MNKLGQTKVKFYCKAVFISMGHVCSNGCYRVKTVLKCRFQTKNSAGTRFPRVPAPLHPSCHHIALLPQAMQLNRRSSREMRFPVVQQRCTLVE